MVFRTAAFIVLPYMARTIFLYYNKAPGGMMEDGNTKNGDAAGISIS